MKTIDSKIEEILYQEMYQPAPKDVRKALEELKSLFQEEMIEIIGEDIHGRNICNSKKCQCEFYDRNWNNYHLRQKVKERMG